MAWGYQRSITIDHTKVPNTDQTDFPVAIAGTYSWLATVANGGHVQSSSGFDIAFYADSGLTTLLDWEIESYNPATGAVVFWVRIPTLSHTADTVIYVAYGDSSITTNQSTPTAVWDSHFLAVYHFGAPSTLSVADSTANGKNGTNSGVTAGTGVIGGGAATYAGSTETLHTPATLPSGNPSQFMTLSVWAKWTGGGSPTDSQNWIVGTHATQCGSEYFLYYAGDGFMARIKGTGCDGDFLGSGGNWKDGSWHYLSFDMNGSVIECFQAGSRYQFQFTSGGGVTQDYLAIGYDPRAGGNLTNWHGLIDEVRLSNIVRTADWQLTEYHNLNSPSTFYALGSETALGVPSPQTITLSAAVTHTRSIPSPTVAGGPQTIHAAPVGPHRSFQNPIVAGPLTVSAVMGPRSIPAPRMNVVQRISLAAAVTGPRSIPAVTVHHVQTIHVGTPPTGARSIPAPTLAGGHQYLNVFGVPSRRSVPAPSVDGGLRDARIYIGGVDVTAYLSQEDGGLQIDAQTIGRWRATAAFNVAQGYTGWRPFTGQTVLITDHGFRLLMGCVYSAQRIRYDYTDQQTKWRLVATDKSSICDRRVVKPVTFPAGMAVVEVIRRLVESSLDGEGISWTVASVDAFNLGVLDSDLVLGWSYVTNAFDQVAQLTGTVWWIDEGLLYLQAFSDLPPAPFGLTEQSRNYRAPGGDFGIHVTETTADYFNRLYAVSNLNVVPGGGGGSGTGTGGAITETYTWGPGNAGIQTGLAPDGSPMANAIITSANIQAITSLKVNGHVQTAVDFGNYAGQAPSGFDLLWFFAGPATGAPSSYVSPTVLPSTGAIIEIQYAPAMTTGSSLTQYGTALDPLDVHGDPLGTCGSGVFEGIVQVQNISDQDTLNAIALAQLNRIGGLPTVVNFETDSPGLKPGQKLHVNIPKAGLANIDLLITQVSGLYIPPELNVNSSFRWTIEARSNLDPGNWIKWYERLVARTANPLPVLQYEDATFVLGAGGSLSGGTSTTNPYIVGRTGRLIEIEAAASNPPIDQDLIITLKRGAQTVYSLRFPAGTAANTLVTFDVPANVNFYLFKRDVLNVDATYQSTGSSPVKASGVTFKARWAI